MIYTTTVNVSENENNCRKIKNICENSRLCKMHKIKNTFEKKFNGKRIIPTTNKIYKKLNFLYLLKLSLKNDNTFKPLPLISLLKILSS